MKSLLLRLALGLARTVVLGRAHRGRAHRRGCPALLKREQRRCPVCGRACDFYDMANRGAPRLWRAMDLARSARYLEYAPCRVRCLSTACAPRPSPGRGTGRRFTRDFEDWVAWLAVRCTASAAPSSPRRVAQRGRRVQARLRRAGGRARRLEVRRRAPHRHRRDVVQEGPQVRHGGRRPRPRLPHLGARGHRQGRAQPVPRRAHARAEARHRGGDRRRREVDKAAGQAPLPQREVGHGPLPRGPVDERRARRRALRGSGTPPGAARAARPRPEASAAGLPKASCRPRRSGRSGRRRPPSRASRYALVKNPRGPHRRPEGEARGASRRGPARGWSGPGAQGGPAGRLQAADG